MNQSREQHARQRVQSNMSICDEQPSVLAQIEAETVQPSKKKHQRRSMRKSGDETRLEAQVELHNESTVQPCPKVRPKKKHQSRSDEPEVTKKCQMKVIARKRSGADETQPEESQPKKKCQMKVMNKKTRKTLQDSIKCIDVGTLIKEGTTALTEEFFEGHLAAFIHDVCEAKQF